MPGMTGLAETDIVNNEGFAGCACGARAEFVWKMSEAFVGSEER
jgi:hypothetical protein